MASSPQLTQRRVGSPATSEKEEEEFGSASSSRATSPTSSAGEKSPLLSQLKASAPAGAAELLEGPSKFVADSLHLLRRCTKPDRKEYVKICQTVFFGFLVMGFLGYFIKLVHIPINNIIVGA